MSLPTLPESPKDHAGVSDWLDRVSEIADAEFTVSRSSGFAWAWARLVGFAGIIGGLYAYGDRGALWGAGLTAVSLLLFVYFVRRHNVCRKRTLTLALAGEVVGEARRRVQGEPVQIRDGSPPGDQAFWEGFFDAYRLDRPAFEITGQEEDDLDLFGAPLSLYGLLNRTSSPVGAARLARAIRNPLSDVPDIQNRQDAVRRLAENGPARIQLMAAAAGLRSETTTCADFVRAVRDTLALPSRIPARAIRWWGLAGPVAATLAVTESFEWTSWGVGWLPLLAVVLINLLIAQYFQREVRERLRPWLGLDQVVNRLRFFSETAVEVLPNDGVLGEQRARLSTALERGGLPALERTIPFLYLGLSGLLHAIVDVLVFWDLQVLGLLERCYLGHRRALLDAVAALGECEMLASLACLAAEEPDATWPEFRESGLGLEIVDGRHPLLAADRAVANSLSLSDPIAMWVVTGSNMSGKSTFLRMTGLTVHLAQIGSAVTARRAVLSPVQLMTDLRIRDDLSREESYFLAEVRQIHRMVRAAESGAAVFGIIDEPFRGTNSEERVAAASAVILALVEGSGVFLVATHDAFLTRLADGERAANRHFRESLDGGQLVFDYRLHDGPAETRNALAVLEHEGYPESLTKRARAFLEQFRQSPSNMDAGPVRSAGTSRPSDSAEPRVG